MSSLVTDTRKRLSELASPEEFETLATAVLREADPSFASLIHVGTNVNGRAVRSPVDGVDLRVHRGARRLLLVQHTITAKKGLRRKWLDPKDGDLIKAQAIFAAEAGRKAVSEATVVLTSTCDPDQELVRDVHAAAGGGLKVDLWPGSRIADFLDRNPEGQWLRQQLFGTAAARLSSSQAREIARRSLDDYLPLVAREDIVTRRLDQEILDFTRSMRGAGFVIGESGLGKSAALRNLGDGWLAAGGIALVLDHEMVEQAATIEQAVTLGLRKWAPSLDAGCGVIALSSASPDRALLLIVEDVNRSANPRRIVERLITWSSNRQGENAASEWRLLCPVWRGNASIAEQDLGKRVLGRSYLVDRFERNEAVDAIRTKAIAAGVDLTTLQCGELAAALGDDPLLIGLNSDWAKPSPKDAILSYVSANIRQAADGQLLASDLRQGLEALAQHMIEAKDIRPSWSEIKSWFASDGDGLTAIRKMVDQGRVVGLGNDDRLTYRHDRVRDHLLVRAVASLIEADRFSSGLWSEPFYAELIGAALGMLPVEIVREAEVRNPVALFAALQDAALDQGRRDRIVEAATGWVGSPGFLDDAGQYRRHHAMRYLARTDGPFVAGLATRFPRSFFRLEALARNGDAAAAARVCMTSDTGMSDRWRDRMISHALSRHPGFTGDLAALLRNKAVPDVLEGALNLAGEIGDPSLCEALAERWLREGPGVVLSTGWLWATLRCCPPIGHRLVEDVCRAWARLPSKEARTQDMPPSNPRWDLAGYTLPSAFSRKPDTVSIDFLLALPKRYRGLRHVVDTIVGHIDTPSAVLHSVRSSAAIDRRIEGTNSINLRSTDLIQKWSPKQHGRAMGAASRSALSKVWQNRRSNRFERRTAFSLWCLTPTAEEIGRLPKIEADPVLADQALRTRLAAGDQSAVPLLRARIEDFENGWRWWYHARDVGLIGLREEVQRFFEKRRLNPPEIDDGFPDHIMAELLMDARDDFATGIIVEHWERLRSSPIYVQAALYLATSQTVALAQAAIRESGDVPRMLRFLDMHWGIRTEGRMGVTELAQLQALEPFYASIMAAEHGEMHIGRFFEAANRLNELEWRRKHLDPLVAVGHRFRYPSDENAVFASLDHEVAMHIEHGRGYFAVDRWFEQREEELWERGTLLSLVGKWARLRADEPAVDLLCEALMHLGERPDLRLFDGLDPALKHVCSDAIANCVYDVRRRSLGA